MINIKVSNYGTKMHTEAEKNLKSIYLQAIHKKQTPPPPKEKPDTKKIQAGL